MILSSRQNRLLQKNFRQLCDLKFIELLKYCGFALRYTYSKVCLMKHYLYEPLYYRQCINWTVSIGKFRKYRYDLKKKKKNCMILASAKAEFTYEYHFIVCACATQSTGNTFSSGGMDNLFNLL